jgi:hypothetical protein
VSSYIIASFGQTLALAKAQIIIYYNANVFLGKDNNNPKDKLF